MSEREVDALMQGQEDENGSVNYESKISKQTRLVFGLAKNITAFRTLMSWITIYIIQHRALLDRIITASSLSSCHFPAFVKHILSV